MKKTIILNRKGKWILFAVVLFLTLTGCGIFSKENSLKNPLYEAYRELDAGNWQEAISIFSEETQGDEPEYIALIGLAKAQIGANDWQSAREVLEKATEQYPHESVAYIYQGEVARHFKDYDQAVESYYYAVKFDIQKNRESGKNFRNLQIRDFFAECLDYAENLQKGYGYAKEIYELNPSDTKILKSLMWIVSRLGTVEAKEELKLAVAGQPQEYAVTTLIQACDELKVGNKEMAETLLFDVQHLKEWEKADFLKFGYSTEEGTMVAVGSQKIFGRSGVIFGPYVNGTWEGECEAWYGESSSVTLWINDTEYKGTRYNDCKFEGNWSNGLPEGSMVCVIDKYSEYPEYVENVTYYDYEYRGEILFSEGMAQGRTEIKAYSAPKGEKFQYSYTRVHEFKDGRAQPFLAETEDGTKLVYEFRYKEGNPVGYLYEEQDCGHSYIWEEWLEI